jgi:hypothetical protein
MDLLAEELETRLIKLPNYGQDKFLFALEYALGNVQLDKHQISTLDKTRRTLYDFMKEGIQKRLDKEKGRQWKNEKLIAECVTYLNLMRDFDKFSPDFTDDIMIGQMAVLKKRVLVKIDGDSYSATVYLPNHTRIQDHVVFLIDGYTDAFESVTLSPSVVQFIKTKRTEETEFSTYYMYKLDFEPFIRTLSNVTRQRLVKQRNPQNLLMSHTLKSIPEKQWKNHTSIQNWKRSQRPVSRKVRERSAIVSTEPFIKPSSHPFPKRYNKPPTIHRNPILISNQNVELENVIEIPNKNVTVEIPKPFKNTKSRKIAPRSMARYSTR